MHELSLACSVVELVGSELCRHGGGTLRTVEVTVGELSGVDSEAFAYALQMPVPGWHSPGCRPVRDAGLAVLFSLPHRSMRLVRNAVATIPGWRPGKSFASRR